MLGRGKDDLRPFDVEYSLPATRVRFSGIKSTITLSYEADSRPTKVTAGVQIEIAADYRKGAARHLTLPRAGNGEVALDLELTEDRRLTSGGLTVDPKNDQVWPTAVSNALLGASAGAALGPAGIIGGAVLGGLGTVAVSGFNVEAIEGVVPVKKQPPPDRDATKVSASELTGQPSDDASYEDAGIVAAYADEHLPEAELLKTYRIAIGNLIQKHATQASTFSNDDPAVDFNALQALERSISSSQRVARRSEALYQAWLGDQVDEQREVVEATWFLDQLPTKQELLDECDDSKFHHDDKPWWTIIEQFQMIVTHDLLSDRRGQPAPKADDGQQHICYREPQHAVVRTWKVRPAPHGGFQSLPPELVESTLMLVAVSNSERYLPVPNEKSAKSGLSIGISPTGGLIKIGSTETSNRVSRAQALAGLGGSVSGALSAGQALSGAFSPTAVETARLRDQAALIEARSKLKPPAADPLAEVRAQVARAELEARLAVAGHLAADPTSARVIVTTD